MVALMEILFFSLEGRGRIILRSCKKSILIILKSPFIFDPNGITQIEYSTVYLSLYSRLHFSHHKNILVMEVKRVLGFISRLNHVPVVFSSIFSLISLVFIAVKWEWDIIGYYQIKIM